MFRADVGVIQSLCFLAGQGQYLFHPRGVRNVSYHLCLGMRADMFLDFHPDGFKVESHLLQDVHCNPLAKFDQSEQKMLCTDVVVVEPVGLFAGERQHLLSAWSKIIHHWVSDAGPSA